MSRRPLSLRLWRWLPTLNSFYQDESCLVALHQSRHHLRDSEEQALVDAMLSPLPKHHFPGEGREGNTTVQLLKEELLLDGNSKQNLATFCQTYQAQSAMELMALGVDKNLIDKDEYP